MKFSFSPQTKWGEQSFALLLVFCFFLVVARIVVAIQHTASSQPLFSNLPLDIPMLSAVVAGILAGIAGIRAIVNDRERSVSVSVATLIGFLIFFLVIRQVVIMF